MYYFDALRCHDTLGPTQSSWAGVIACRTGSGANSVWTGVGMWSHGKHDGNSSQPVRHSLFTNEDLNSIFRILGMFHFDTVGDYYSFDTVTWSV